MCYRKKVRDILLCRDETFRLRKLVKSKYAVFLRNKSALLKYSSFTDWEANEAIGRLKKCQPSIPNDQPRFEGHQWWLAQEIGDGFKHLQEAASDNWSS